jgi:hypothetical protein
MTTELLDGAALIRKQVAISLAQVGIVDDDWQDQYALDYTTTDRLIHELALRRVTLVLAAAESEGDYVRRVFRELHRRLVLPPEHGADSIDAAIGYALNDCETAVMAALYASNTPRAAHPEEAPRGET